MKKIFALIIALLLAIICVAGNHHGRVGVGYDNILSLGAGYNVSEHFSLGVEADAWSDFCGLTGGIDPKLQLSDCKEKPDSNSKNQSES